MQPKAGKYKDLCKVDRAATIAGCFQRKANTNAKAKTETKIKVGANGNAKKQPRVLQSKELWFTTQSGVESPARPEARSQESGVRS